MPFKSRAQRRKFAQLLVEGKISDKTFEEWNRETGGRHLPERVKPKAARRAKTKKAKKAKRMSRKTTRKAVKRVRTSARARKR
jgi:hypothetical protein